MRWFLFGYRAGPLAGLLALCGSKRSCSQAEMSCFYCRPGPCWAPGPVWSPGPVWTQKTLFSSRNELFVVQTWTMLGSWPCVDPKEAVLKQK